MPVGTGGKQKFSVGRFVPKLIFAGFGNMWILREEMERRLYLWLKDIDPK